MCSVVCSVCDSVCCVSVMYGIVCICVKEMAELRKMGRKCRF